MSRIRQCAVVSGVAMAALVAPAGAQAATPHWHTIDKIAGAKLQVCKVHAKAGWKIKGRVDGRKAAGKTTGSLTVTYKNAPTKRHWTSGWVKAHHVGKAGSVVLPRKAGYKVTFALGTNAMGDGGVVGAKKIGRC
ncbi:MAG TPA: hypothetical protein VF426_10205 [Marmoricola sp.]